MSAIRDDLKAIRDEIHGVRSDVQWLRSEVETLRRKASFWGVIGGSLTALLTHLGGCL